MPRFFFQIVNHRFDEDKNGMELPDLVAARREAITLAGAVMADEPSRLGFNSALHVQVFDESQRCVLIVATQVLEIADFIPSGA